jgi:hypothetical protein
MLKTQNHRILHLGVPEELTETLRPKSGTPWVPTCSEHNILGLGTPKVKIPYFLTQVRLG